MGLDHTAVERRALAWALLLACLGLGIFVGRGRPPQPVAAQLDQATVTEAPTELPTIVRTASATVPPPPTVTAPPSPTALAASPTPVAVSATPPPSSTPSPGPTATLTPPPSLTPDPRTPTATRDPRRTDTPVPASVTPSASDTPRPAPPTPPPSRTPTVEPTPRSREIQWLVRIWAFIDTVGKGPYKCTGCDGLWSDGDVFQAISCPLEPLYVVISNGDDPTEIYAQVTLRRDMPRLDITHNFLLSKPPPYELRLVTTNPRCYTVCPNVDVVRRIEQRDFDLVRNSRPGTGRYFEHKWGFWRCEKLVTPTPVPVNCAIHPDTTSRTCNGNSYAGYNGNFETAGRRPETPADWLGVTYGGRVTAPRFPAIGTASLQLRETAAGVSGRASHGLSIQPGGPLQATLKLRLFRRDAGAGAFSLRAQMDAAPEQVLVTEASQGPVGQWNLHTAVMNVAGAGPHTFSLRWDVAPGVELFVDDVDLDFCCDRPVQITPSSTPTPSDTPTPTPSMTPTPTTTPR
jgi:hypothetical protein